MADETLSGTVSNDDDDKPSSRVKSRIGAAGKSLSESGQRTLGAIAAKDADRGDTQSPNTMGPPSMSSYKRGGRVRKTGPALLHRGEKVRAGKRKRGRGRRTRAAGRY